MSTLEPNDDFQDRGLIKIIGKNGTTAIYNVAEVTTAGEIRVIQSFLSGVINDVNPKTFEDTDFVSGDSPVTLDLNTALGRNSIYFDLENDGPGTVTIALSNDGSSFGDEHTLKAGEKYPLNNNISVDSIRITHVTDAAYRVLAI